MDKRRETNVVLTRKSDKENIFVIDRDGSRFLLFDAFVDQSVISLKTKELIGAYLNYMLGVFLFHMEFPSRALVLGVGGGSLMRFLRERLPHIEIVGVEYDQIVLDIAREYFALPRADSHCEYVVERAEVYVSRAKDNSTDVLLIDLFNSEGMADCLFSSSFYHDCYRCLSDNGSLALNVNVSNAETLIRLLKIVRKVFNRRCLYVNIPNHDNIIVFAFKNRPGNEQFIDILLRAEVLTEILGIPVSGIWNEIKEFNPSYRSDGLKRDLWDLIP